MKSGAEEAIVESLALFIGVSFRFLSLFIDRRCQGEHCSGQPPSRFIGHGIFIWHGMSPLGEYESPILTGLVYLEPRYRTASGRPAL